MLKKIETSVLMYICAQDDFIINFYCKCAQEDSSTRLYLGVTLLGVNTVSKERRPVPNGFQKRSTYFEQN